jgi:serine/threonine-protein kinase
VSKLLNDSDKKLMKKLHELFWLPRFSPAGKHVAVAIGEPGNSDIWVYDLEGDTGSRLTWERGHNAVPFWTPNGERVTFSSSREGTTDVFWVPADGSGSPEPLVVADNSQYGSSWTPDGKRLFFAEYHQQTGRNIWTLSLTGDSKTRPYLVTPFNEFGASVSTDGKWLAYLSDESGRLDVYVRALDGVGGRYPISRNGASGVMPQWAAKGRELFYCTAEKMVSATVETDPVFKVVKRQVLFELTPYISGFDIHPDGDRFVMIKEDETSSQIIVVVNWFEELKRKVPTDH